METPELLNIFEKRYGGNPRVFRSPGRINIIGEHTDYNNGFVLPTAIDKDMRMVIRKSQTDTFQIYAAGQDEDGFDGL